MYARRWLLLATVSTTLLLITLDNSILYTALPTLTQELSASPSESLWIINAYPLVMAGLLLGAGTLGDRVGHRKMLIIGLVIFGTASVFAAFAPSAGALIAARATLAIGAASMMPATLALIRIGFTNVRERNLAIAIWGSISVLGMALGPVVSGALLATFWWGSVFLVNVPIVIVALIVIQFVAPKNDPDHTRMWDLISSLLAMVTLVGLVLFIKSAAQASPDWRMIGISAALAVVGSILFMHRQRRLTQPLLDFAVFRNRAFSTGVGAAALAMFAVAGFQLITTQRFQLVAGFTPLQSGLLIGALALGSLPTSLLAGAFLHVTGLRMVVTSGLALGGVGALIVAATLGHGLAPVVAGLMVIGGGIGAVMAVASTAIIGNVSERRAGMASSIEEVSYEFGSLIAVALLGTLLGTFYSSGISLPAGAPPQASESLAGALLANDPAILDAAFTAFDTGYRFIAIIIATLMIVGAMVAARTLRTYGVRTESTLVEVTEALKESDEAKQL